MPPDGVHDPGFPLEVEFEFDLLSQLIDLRLGMQISVSLTTTMQTSHWSTKQADLRFGILTVVGTYVAGG